MIALIPSILGHSKDTKKALTTTNSARPAEYPEKSWAKERPTTDHQETRPSRCYEIPQCHCQQHVRQENRKTTLTPTDPDWLLADADSPSELWLYMCTFEKSTRGVNKKTICVFFGKDLNINSVVSFSAFRLRSKLKHFWHICQMRSSSNDPMCGW